MFRRWFAPPGFRSAAYSLPAPDAKGGERQMVVELIVAILNAFSEFAEENYEELTLDQDG
jgi:hypothetical protein